MSKHIFLIFLFFLLPILLFAKEYEVEKISFRDVSYKGDERLKDIIHSEKGKNFDLRLIKLDKILLINYYKKNGYMDVEVADSVAYFKKRSEVRIYYTIHEGQRYYYGGVRLRGNTEIPSRDLITKFDEVLLYEPFDESRITNAVKRVEDVFYNSGKPFAEIGVDYLYEQDSLMVVLLKIKENQTVYIKKISYQGLEQVKKFLIRRELVFGKEDRYDRSKMEQSQQNLYGTGLFKYVQFKMEPIENEPGQTILNIFIQEKNPRWVGVRFGMAHEQETYYGNKFEFTLQGGHRNLFGTARSISVHATPSLIYDLSKKRLHNPDNKIAIQFVEPWILATRTPGTLQLGYEQYRPLNSDAFDVWRTSFGLKRMYGKYTQVTAALSAKLVDMQADAQIDSVLSVTVRADQSKIYALTFYWKRDNRKNLFNPFASSYTDVSFSFSYSENLDEQLATYYNNYIVLNASWQRYMPWRPKVPYFKRANFTFASRVKTGMIYELGEKGSIPINDLFFAGGATSVRGYQEQLLGPALTVDSKGKITKAAGGKFLFLGNLEARIPLFWLFVAEIFVDAGYVWPEIIDVRPVDLRLSTGAGIALLTPLGPVRVDYGYKLMPSDLDPTPDAFHFGIYFAF